MARTMSQPGPTVNVDRLILPIAGLGCGGGGALTVERQIGRLDGVRRVYVNPATEMAYVEIDTTRVARSDVVEAIQRAGFGVDEDDRRVIW